MASKSSAPGEIVVEDKPSLWTRLRAQRPGIWVLPVLAIILIGVLFIVVGPVYNTFKNDASPTSSSKGATLYLHNNTISATCPVCPDEDSDPSCAYIHLKVDVPQLMAAQASVKLVVNIDPVGQFSNSLGWLNVKANQTLQLQLGKTKVSFKDSDVLTKVELNEFMEYANGYSSYTFYPMDSYTITPIATATLITKVNGAEENEPVDLCMTFANHLSTFDSDIEDKSGGFYYDPEPGQAFGYAYMQLRFTRTKATRFFSIFIVILMWALSGLQLALAVDHLFIRPREPVPPTIGFSIALLFALPAVRNTQPEVPPIGVAVDVLGFFWNMSITALAASMLMAAFMGYHKASPMK